MKILAGDWPEGRQAVTRTTFAGKAKELLLFKGVLAHDVLPIGEIVSADIVTAENKASIAGKVGWGAVGAIALGPIGLLAGALLGGNRQQVVLAVVFKDGRKVLLEGKSKDMQPLIAAAF